MVEYEPVLEPKKNFLHRKVNNQNRTINNEHEMSYHGKRKRNIYILHRHSHSINGLKMQSSAVIEKNWSIINPVRHPHTVYLYYVCIGRSKYKKETDATPYFVHTLICSDRSISILKMFADEDRDCILLYFIALLCLNFCLSKLCSLCSLLIVSNSHLF